MAAPLTLLGAPGSPYSRKMRALVRFRRVPYVWIQRGSKEDPKPKVPVNLMPVIVFPGESEGMIDSTFQIRRLEELSSERSVVHPDPALAFLDHLVEDYGDEWLTKPMFHYRWAYEADVKHAASILPRWSAISAPDEVVAGFSKVFSERQIGRLGVVGSNETTRPVIEQSYRRFLRAFDALLTEQPYVMGQRPGTSDFGLFGQLTQLAFFDPTPVAVTREESPRVVAWCELAEDLSGVEVGDADWLTRDAVSDAFRGLLAEIGRTYAPFLLGNAAALTSGAERVECTIDGRPWTQKPFPYQGKCLGWLREGYAALPSQDRAWVASQLADTGCESLFAS